MNILDTKLFIAILLTLVTFLIAVFATIGLFRLIFEAIGWCSCKYKIELRKVTDVGELLIGCAMLATFAGIGTVLTYAVRQFFPFM